MSSPFQCRLRLSRREGRLRELRRGKDVRSLWPAPEAAAAREPAAEAREAPEWRDVPFSPRAPSAPSAPPRAPEAPAFDRSAVARPAPPGLPPPGVPGATGKSDASPCEDADAPHCALPPAARGASTPPRAALRLRDVNVRTPLGFQSKSLSDLRNDPPPGLLSRVGHAPPGLRRGAAAARGDITTNRGPPPGLHLAAPRGATTSAARTSAACAPALDDLDEAAARTSALEDRAAADGEATDGASAADGAAAPRARGDARVVRGGALPRRNGAVLLFLAICIAVLAVAVHACLARSHVGVSTVADEARIFITQPARGQLVTKLRTRLQWSFSDSLTARAQLSVVGMEVWVDDSLFIGGADDPRGRLEMPSWNGVEPFQLALTLNQMQIGLHNVTVVVRSFEAKFSTVTNTTLFVTLPAPSPAT